ncbi:hypothetical protein HWV62_24079 [Athelia sp. TMB]|nr:hypothetical protein HWV62_24079 [Athelia sp. TMB]
MAIISHWFKKRRGLALGLTAAGSSIGGTVFPIAAKRLITETLERRLPSKRVAGGLLNLSAFKNKAYTVYCISGFVTFLGLYTVLTYIEVSALSIGIDPNFAFYLISIASASSLFGRLFSGVVADRTGALNVMTPLTLLAGVMTYIWPFAKTKTSLIIIAIFYGQFSPTMANTLLLRFGSGAYVSLLAAPMIALGGVEDVGRRVGMGMTILALGALAGPPISGAVERATGGFEAVGFYAARLRRCFDYERSLNMLASITATANSLWGSGRAQNDAHQPTTAIVSKLFIHPVKSCRGIEVDEAYVTQNGFKYDRECVIYPLTGAWRVANNFLLVAADGSLWKPRSRSKTHRFCIGRKNPKLTLIHTVLEPPHLRIIIPARPNAEPSRHALTAEESGTVISVLSDPTASDLSDCDILPYVQIWNDYVEAYAVSREADHALSVYLGKNVRLVKLGRLEDGGSARPSSGECSDPRLDYFDSTIAAQDQYPLTIATMPSLHAVQDSIIANAHPKIKLDPAVWSEQRAKTIDIKRYR